MCVILLGCVQICNFYRTLFRGLLFSGHSVMHYTTITYKMIITCQP